MTMDTPLTPRIEGRLGDAIQSGHQETGMADLL